MENAPGEWIVSYHGTSAGNIRSIVEGGYDLSKCRLFAYGKGVYSANTIGDAEGYATVFTWEGRQFQVAFMNRVNPSPQHLTRVGAASPYYFISKSDKDIRPYGLLIKKIS